MRATLLPTFATHAEISKTAADTGMLLKSKPLDDRSVTCLFEEQVKRTPDSLAVSCGSRQVTYAEFNLIANRIAGLLLNLGIKKGDRVGIAVHPSIESLASFYGVLKSGGVYVPLDTSYPEVRLQYMIQQSGARILVHDAELPAAFKDIDLQCVPLNEITLNDASLPDENPGIAVGSDDLIYVIFTSGSTGTPKGAAVYHRGFTNLVNWFNDYFDLGDEDKNCLVSSLSFDLTQKNLYAPLICGGAITLRESTVYDPQDILDTVAKEKVTYLNCAPSAFYPIVKLAESSDFEQLQSIRYAFLGGEPINLESMRGWLQHPSCYARIANTYGPTECSDVVAGYTIDDPSKHYSGTVPIGLPVYNTQLHIMDDDLTPLPQGEVGEICISGVCVGQGYINDARMTAEKFVTLPSRQGPHEKIYRTGDLGRVNDDGLFEFVGRIDTQVKIRGYRIELDEIQAALQSHGAVESCVVIARSDEGEDPMLVAYIVPAENYSGADLSGTLRDHLRKSLPEYMVPSWFIEIESIPLNPNGKLDRKALPAPEYNIFQDLMLKIETDPVTAKILRIWQETLKNNSLGLDDEFFDIGGDSLLAVDLSLSLNEAFEAQFPLTEIMACSTVRSMADYVKDRQSLSASSSTANGAPISSPATLTDIVLREARPEDYEAIMAVCRRNGMYTRDAPTREEWNGLWQSNPWRTEAQELPMGWILEDRNSNVVGTNSNVPVMYCLNNQPILASATTTGAIDEAFRQHAALLFQKHFNQKGPKLLLNTSASEAVAAMWASFGSEIIPSEALAHELRWIGSYAELSRHYAFKLPTPLDRPAGVCAFAVLRAFDAINQSRSRGTAEGISFQTDFTDDFDGLWEQLKRYPDRLLTWRDRAALEWHFRIPSNRGNIIIAVKKEHGLLQGYAVGIIRTEGPARVGEMIIADLQTLDDTFESTTGLMSALLDFARKKRISSVRARGFGATKNRALLSLNPRVSAVRTNSYLYKLCDKDLATAMENAEWDVCPFDGDATLF